MKLMAIAVVLLGACASLPVGDVVTKARLATKLAACVDGAYTDYVKASPTQPDAGSADAGVHE